MIEWQEYKRRFVRKAKKARLDQDEIDSCLSYALNLYNKNVAIIFDQEHLSRLCGISYDYLIKASNSPHQFYREFYIPKRSGGSRLISEPLPTLKYIQRWINDHILSKCEISKYAKAYLKDTSIKDNARFHRKQNFVLTIDINNFFGTIKFPRVYRIYKKIGYSEAVSTMLANLNCLNNCLPQGAPTSPALSNLVAERMDKRIAGFTRKYDIRYTRYADDLTFSGNFNPGFIIKEDAPVSC